MKPYLFQLPDWLPIAGGRPIFSYGVMLGLSFILGWGLTVHLSRRDGIDGKIASNGVFVIVLSSLIGARAMHFMSSPTAQFSIANFLKFDEGGLVAYGGIVAALAGCMLYTWFKGVDPWVYIDEAAAPLSLGLGITRVGCFLFGCDYGVTTTSALAIRFPRWEDPEVLPWIKRSAPAYMDHHANAFDAVDNFSRFVHPTQLYESLVGFIGFAICIVWLRRKRFHGQIMFFFMAYYGVLRYALEIIRGDADRGDDIGGLGLSTSQLTAILTMAVIGVLWWRQGRRGLYDASGTTQWATATGPARADSPRPQKKSRRGRPHNG